MRRRTFDAVAIIAGLVLTVVLAIGGGLLLWGQLPASDAAAVQQYAGQTMTTGAQAQTWADHFIRIQSNAV